MTLIGVRGGAVAVVDELGKVASRSGRWSFDWWIGAEDRWRRPAEEASVRQQLIDRSPVVETAMRVPGGDAVHRAYGVAAPEDLVVVEVENRSPAPFVVAFASRGASLLSRRPPSRVEDGALLFPLAHRATLQVALPLVRRRVPEVLWPLPSAADAARGWEAHARSGMRFDLPPGRIADAVEANRRFLLLSPMSPPRRRARSLARLQELVDTASDTFTWPASRAGAELVALVRDLLVREAADGSVSLCAELPEAWLGQPIEAHEVPISGGVVSFAVRWHGERPALLWEVRTERPVHVTCPALDPAWSTAESRGDSILRSAP